jgi:hypothetical protein
VTLKVQPEPDDDEYWSTTLLIPVAVIVAVTPVIAHGLLVEHPVAAVGIDPEISKPATLPL